MLQPVPVALQAVLVALQAVPVALQAVLVALQAVLDALQAVLVSLQAVLVALQAVLVALSSHAMAAVAASAGVSADAGLRLLETDGPSMIEFEFEYGSFNYDFNLTFFHSEPFCPSSRGDLLGFQSSVDCLFQQPPIGVNLRYDQLKRL